MSLQFGLKEASLIKNQGFIAGKWVDAKDGGKIAVTSEPPTINYPLTLRFSNQIVGKTPLLWIRWGRCQKWAWRKQKRPSTPLRPHYQNGATPQPRFVDSD